MNEVLDAIGDTGFTISAVGANLFVILYSLLAKPWKSASGIHIFSFMLVVALILDHSAIVVNFPGYPGYLWVRAVLYMALAAVILWRVMILLKVQMSLSDQSEENANRENQK